MAAKKGTSTSPLRPQAREMQLPPQAGRWLLLGLLLIWVACSAFVAARVPEGDAPDESAHLVYVGLLAQTHHFVDFTTQPRGTETHQPPLYYLLCAALRTAGAPLFLLRLLSTLCGAGTIVLTYLLAREWRPGAGPLFAAACAAAVGFLPMNLYLCSAVNNDPAANLLVAAGLFALWRTRQSKGWRGPVLVGTLCALAMLTKSTTTALLVACSAWYALGLREREGRRAALLRLAAFLAPVLLLWGPWAARNTLLYGDPLAARAFAAVAAGAPADQFGAPGPAYWIGMILPWSWFTALGAYSHLDQPADFMPAAWYQAFIPLAVLALAGLAWRIRPARWDPPARAMALCMWLGGLVLLAGYVSFNLGVFQAQSRYFFTYLPVAAIALCTGLEKLHPRWGSVALLVLLLLLATGCLDGVSWRMWHAALPPA